jgi:hypothetical protein
VKGKRKAKESWNRMSKEEQDMFLEKLRNKRKKNTILKGLIILSLGIFTLILLGIFIGGII